MFLPSPARPFQYTCDRSSEAVPYAVSYVPQLQDPTAHCFRINVRGCDAAGPCCHMDLYKIIINSSELIHWLVAYSGAEPLGHRA